MRKGQAGRAGLVRRAAMSTAAFVPISLATTMAAQAQTVDEGNAQSYVRPYTLDAILVEGELQTRSLQDTQTSVTVIPGAELDRLPDNDLYDVIERTPNVSASFGEQGFSIRGVDQRGPGAAGTGMLVNVSVDGATLPDNQATFYGPYGTWDLDQVEVLRGPQSTQQGRNALAGAIVIRTADPTYKQEVKVRGQAGSRDTLGGAFAVNQPLVDDVLAIRVAGEALTTDGFVKNPTLDTDDYDGKDLGVIRGKVLFEPVDNFSAVGTASFTYNAGGEDYVSFSDYPDERNNYSNEPAAESSHHTILGLRMAYDFTDAWALHSETSWYHNDYARQEDFDYTAAPGGTLARDRDTFSVEEDLRLAYEGDTLSGVLGFYYLDVRADNDSTVNVPGTFVRPLLPPSITITQDTVSSIDTRNLAIFGEVEYEVIDDLSLVAGGRYDNESVDYKDTTVVTSSVPLPIPLPPTERVASDTSFDAFLPKFGVVYDWTEDLSTGFTVQRGYRAGGTQRNIATGQLNEFDPEYTWNYELSVRSQWLNKALTANANAFYARWNDQQVNVIGPSGLSFDFNTVNAGKSEYYGGELELIYLPMDNLDLFGSLGLVQTKFIEFRNQGIDYADNEFPFAPNVTGAFGASYYFDWGIELHGDASYTGPSYVTIDNTSDQKADGRFLVNARVGYAQEQFSLFLYGRNLTDVDYITQVTPGRTVVRTGEPLTVGVLFNANF